VYNSSWLFAFALGEQILKILLSNDDGIYAAGLRALAERLAKEPALSVYVVAPDRERSATGHALTLHKPIRVEEVQLGANIKAWATTGTPSDCIKFGLEVLLEEKPDFIVSGINSGPNLGSEVLYSGTVSAAMEGAILGIPSIACSLVGRSVSHYETAAEFIARLLKLLPSAGLSKRTLLNVNVPNIPLSEIKGVAPSELSVRAYNDRYEKRLDPRGKVYYWLAGEAIDEGESESSDTHYVLNKYIAITPISFNMTDRETLGTMNGWSNLKTLMQNPAPTPGSIIADQPSSTGAKD
jgi:5'-nucleotidase